MSLRNCLAISTPLSSHVLTGIYGLVPRAGSRAPEKPPGPSTRADDAGGLAWGGVGELGIGQSGNLDVEIDAVEQEARGRGGRGAARRRVGSAGKAAAPATRETTTRASSSGWQSVSSKCEENPAYYGEQTGHAADGVREYSLASQEPTD